MKKILEMFKKIENKYPTLVKVYDKTNVIIEFILSLIFTWCMYKIIFIKHYVGFWSKPYVAVYAILCFMILCIAIINIIKYKDKLEKLFLTFIIPIGMMYMMFILPYHAPDEAPHFMRAYEVYHGEFFATLNDEGLHRAKAPESLEKLNLGNLNNYQNLMEHIEEESNYETKKEVYTEAQSYPGISYLASGLGMRIGEMLHLNIILTMYLARMCNFIVFLIFAYLAIKVIPFGKLVVSVYFVMPMMLQQATSASPDALINPICIFFIAYILKLVFAKQDLTKKNIIIVWLLSIFVAVTKIVYFPIVFLLLLLIPNKHISKKHKILLIVTSIVLAVAIGGAWYVFQTRYTDEREYVQTRNINATEQIQYILKNPRQYAKTLQNIIELQGMDYLYGMIGYRLSWTGVEVPDSVILLYIILLSVAGWLEKYEVALNAKQKVWMILIMLGVCLLVYTALYVGWTEVGMQLVIGVQGRYFIPIAILGLLCLCMKENYVKIKQINLIYMLCMTGINLCAINAIIYYFLK